MSRFAACPPWTWGIGMTEAGRSKVGITTTGVEVEGEGTAKDLAKVALDLWDKTTETRRIRAEHVDGVGFRAARAAALGKRASEVRGGAKAEQ